MEKKKLNELIEQLGFECVAGSGFLDRCPESAYVSDLLSDVMGNAQAGMLWVTSQVHKNILAVASLKELSAIVIAGGRRPAEDVLECAEQEEVVIVLSRLSTFDTVGKIYNTLEETK